MSTRRPMTAADATLGAIVYFGNLALRIIAIDAATDRFKVVKASAKSDKQALARGWVTANKYEVIA